MEKYIKEFKKWFKQRITKGATENTAKDVLWTNYSLLKNNIRYLFKVQPKKFKTHHNFVLEETFKNLDKWRKNLWWGGYSENETTSYFDEKALKITDEGLHITYKNSPRINRHTGVRMEWMTGTVESLDSYGKGSFEVICEILPGTGVWYAPLWFVTKGDGSKEEFTVLPEPDVCEFYTKGDINNFKAQTNFHYGKGYSEELHKMIGAVTHKIRNVYNREISFAMIWEDDYIEFYYDGHLVRKITNREILDNMKEQIVIIGTGVKRGEQNKYTKEGGGLIVKSFKYWAK